MKTFLTADGRQAVSKAASSTLPTPYGTFDITIFSASADGREHVALTLGTLAAPVLTRVHSACLTGDTLLSLRCDCREQLHESMRRIQEAGSGVILYLNQEGRGIGLVSKIKAYALQDVGHDTVEANEALGFPPDAREYAMAAAFLHALGIKEVRLLTNNPHKEKELIAHGITIAECIPLESEPTEENRRYLAAKKRKLRHRLRKV